MVIVICLYALVKAVYEDIIDPVSKIQAIKKELELNSV